MSPAGIGEWGAALVSTTQEPAVSVVTGATDVILKDPGMMPLRFRPRIVLAGSVSTAQAPGVTLAFGNQGAAPAREPDLSPV